MKIRRVGTQLGYSLFGVLVFIGMSPAPARAQDGHTHVSASQYREQTREEKNQASALERFS